MEPTASQLPLESSHGGQVQRRRTLRLRSGLGLAWTHHGPSNHLSFIMPLFLQKLHSCIIYRNYFPSLCETIQRSFCRSPNPQASALPRSALLLGLVILDLCLRSFEVRSCNCFGSHCALQSPRKKLRSRRRKQSKCSNHWQGTRHSNNLTRLNFTTEDTGSMTL